MTYLPPTFAARPDLTFDFGLFCLDCRYNLRGLTRDARCPECGTPIAATLATDLLYLADPGWLSRLIAGYLLLLIGTCTPVLFVLLLLLRDGEPLSLLSLCLGTLLLAVGGWLITTPEPARPNPTPAARSLRTLVRGACLLSVASLLPAPFLFNGPALFCVLTLLLSLITGLIAILLQSATLPQRLVCTGHARFARGLAVLIGATLLLVSPAIVAGIIGAEPDNPAILLPSCTAMLSLFFLFPALLVLFHQLRAYLIAARNYALYVLPDDHDPMTA
jgi:hypothetical protein